MTPDDDGLTQRERRAQQHKASKPKVQLPKANMKQWLGPIVILVLVGGAVALTLANDAADEANGCSSHYHYTMDLFLDGEKVILNPAGDRTFTTVGSDLHMHESQGADAQRNLIHTHAGGGASAGLHADNCRSFGDAFGKLSIAMSNDALTLRAAHGDNQGTYEANDAKSLRVFGKGWDDDSWMELELTTINRMVPPVSSQFAVIYGDANADALALLQAQGTPYPGSTYAPPQDAHYTSYSDLRRI